MMLLRLLGDFASIRSTYQRENIRSDEKETKTQQQDNTRPRSFYAARWVGWSAKVPSKHGERNRTAIVVFESSVLRAFLLSVECTCQ